MITVRITINGEPIDIINAVNEGHPGTRGAPADYRRYDCYYRKKGKFIRGKIIHHRRSKGPIALAIKMLKVLREVRND